MVSKEKSLIYSAEYVKHFNKTRAYKIANKSCKSYKGASVNASRIHNQYMNKALENTSAIERITPEWVINQLEELARTSKRDADRIRATELLGQTLALFRQHSIQENREVSVSERNILLKYMPEDKLKGIKTVKDSINDVPCSGS